MNQIAKFRWLFIFLALSIALVIFISTVPLPKQTATLKTIKKGISSDIDAIRGFIEWFGVLYGLLIAFILIEAWTNFNRVNEEIDKEADALQMLDWTARLLENEMRVPLTQAIKEYAQYTLEAKGIHEDNIVVRDMTIDLFLKVKDLLKDSETVAENIEIIRQLNDTLDTRGDRRQHAKNKIPSPMWGALILTTIIWLLAYLGMGTHNVWIGYLISGSATLSVVMILFIIQDLLKPYQGAIRVDFSSFNDLLRNLEHWPVENKKSE